MKRFFMILCLTVLLAVVLAVPALAAEGDHTHCICGGTLEGTEGHTCEDVTYTVVTTADEFTAQFTAEGTGTVNICLGSNITISSNIGITGKTVNLCLNSYTITMSGSGRLTANSSDGTTETAGTFNICEHNGGGIVAASGCTQSFLYVYFGQLNLYGGTVDASAINTSTGYGGAALVHGASDVMTMYGGTIIGGKTARGGAVYASQGGTFVMKGGIIRDGEASLGGNVSVNFGSVIMSGGTITGGVATTTGGGVNMGYNATTFELSGDAKIYGNSLEKNSVKSSSDVHLGFKSNVYVTLGQWDGNGVNEEGLANPALVLTHKTAAPAAGTILVKFATEPKQPREMKGYFGLAGLDGYQMAATFSNITLQTLDAHLHCHCNEQFAGVGEHVCEDIVYTAKTAAEFTALFTDNALTANQNVYLTEAVTLDAGYTTGGKTLNVCLHGQTVTMSGAGNLTVDGSGALNIADCAEAAGSIVAAEDSVSSLLCTKGGSVSLFAGTVDASKNNPAPNSGSNTYGGAVWLQTDGDLFAMYDGCIVGSKGVTHGGAIYAGGGTKTKVNIHGGTIRDGYASVLGGNIDMNRGTLTVTGGTITGGAAGGDSNGLGGGGICIEYNALPMVLSGDAKIYGNQGTSTTTTTGGADVRLNGNEDNNNIALGQWNGNGEGNPVMAVTKLTPVAGELIVGFTTEVEKPYDVKALFNLVDMDGWQMAASFESITAQPTTAHVHCPCNGNATNVGSHVCHDVVYTAKTGEGFLALFKSNALTADQNVYLTDSNAEITADYKLSGYTMNLCLHGQTVTMSTDGRLTANGTTGLLTIADCAETVGQILAASECRNRILYTYKGHIDLFNGKVDGTNVRKYHSAGGTVFLDFAGDSLTMYGGTIQGSTLGTLTLGSSVYVDSDTTFDLYGGTIQGGITAISGGNVHVVGTMNVHGGTVTGGSAPAGGNISVEEGGTLKVKGGFVQSGSATTETADGTLGGGNIYVLGAMEMSAGQFTGGSAYYGGSVFVGDGGSLTLSGSGIITGGTATKHTDHTNGGGNVCVASGGSFTMTAGTVSSGTSNQNGGDFGGGNVCVLNGGTMSLSGTGLIEKGTCAKRFGGNVCILGEMNMSGGTVQDGTAKYGGGNVMISNDGVFNMSGGLITGGLSTESNFGNGVFMRNLASTFTLSGSAKIYGNRTTEGSKCDVCVADAADTEGVRKAITLNGWEGNGANNPKLIVDRQNDNFAYRFAVFASEADAEAVTYFKSRNASYFVSLQETGDGPQLFLADSGSFAVREADGSLVYLAGLQDAIDVLKTENGVITLNESVDEDIIINKNMYLDLNGFNVKSVKVEAGKTLKLVDAATADYAVDTDEKGYLTGYGMIESFTGSGGYDVFFNTDTDTYGKNYKYLVLEDTDENGNTCLHAHRVYLSVKSVVLYPKTTSLKYKTVFYCDQVVADAVAEYGIDVSALEQKSAKLDAPAAYSATNNNSQITQVTQFLTEASREEWVTRTETALKANAYLVLKNGTVLTSSKKTTTFKAVVTKALADESLNEKQKVAMVTMHRTYEELMHPWCGSGENLMHTDWLANTYCLCGGSETVGPCAEAGHTQLYWSAWDGTSTSGNYYLEGDTDTATIEVSETLNIDLRGHSWTATGGQALSVKDGGAANITDSIVTKGSVLGAGAAGGTVTVASGGSLTLYGGVNMNAPAGVDNGGVAYVAGNMTIVDASLTGGSVSECGGSVYVSGGSLVMYGGSITGGTATGIKQGNGGGNVYIRGGGQFYMYGGTVSGGRVVGAAEYINDGETVQQHGDGGNINVNNGTFTMTGGTVTDGSAESAVSATPGNGGGVYVGWSGNVNISGQAQIYGNTTTDIMLCGRSGKTVTLGAWDGNGEGGALKISRLSMEDYPQVITFDSGLTAAQKLELLGHFASTVEGYGLTLSGDKTRAELTPVHTHCVCNGTQAGVGTHASCTPVTYTRIASKADFDSLFNGSRVLEQNVSAYLTADITLTQEYKTAGYVLDLCLNGHTITMQSDGGLTASGETGILNITDCDGDGQILADGCNYGMLYTWGGQINLFGGTVNGMNSAAGNYGTVRLGVAGDAISVYNGTLYGSQNAKYGGAIGMTVAAHVYVYGGTITGGTASSHGGNICAYEAAGTVEIRGGTVSGGTAGSRGGNICIYNAAGTVEIHGGTVSGGHAALGGNIGMHKGSLTVTGGIITGGSAAGDSNGLGGGAIAMEYGASSLQLSGNARIYGNTALSAEVTTGGADIRLNGGDHNVITLGQWTGNQAGDPAPVLFKVNGAVGSYVVKFATGENAPANPYTMKANFAASGYQLAMLDSTGLTLQDANAHIHCVCGGELAGTEGHSCVDTVFTAATQDSFTADEDEENADAAKLFEKWTDGNIRLKADANIYLSEDVTLEAAYVTSGHTLNLCLCGNTLTMAGETARMTANRAKDGTVNGTLNITACQDGKILAGENSKSGFLYTWNGSINLYNGTVDVSGKSIYAVRVDTNGNGDTFTMYGGTIRAGAVSGGAVYVNGGAVVMNGGLITAEGNEITSHGGAVYVAPNKKAVGSFTMNGGQITGGTANRGGAVYVPGGSFTMNGGTISGGKATTYGGNVAVNRNTVNDVVYDGVFTMTGGTLTGGTAEWGGGNLFLSGSSANISGGTITAGVSNADGSDLENHFGGGNVCVGYESSLSVSGGTITDGVCAMGREDVAVQPNSFTTSLSGAPVIGDLYLVGKSLTVDTAMTGNQSVGVTLQSGTGELAAGDGAAASAGAFRSNEGYTISADGSRLLLTDGTQAYTVGYGQGDITPTDEDVAAGLYLQGFSSDTHVTNSTTPVETLLATAMAVTDAKGDTVLLISVDSCNIGSSATTKARLNVSKATGVPVDNIAISAAHQHSTPYVNTVKWSQEAYDAEIAAGNTPSFNVGDVRTDYAATFHEGVVAAAKNAMAARANVSNLEIATVNTTGKGANGANFNYVRNIVLKSGSTVVGTITDNHRDVGTVMENFYSKSYESEVDRTMQLMKYTMVNGRTVILANFQTHPHLGGNPDTPMVHADIVGAFRDSLKTDTTDVIYFSGASGDVNPRDTYLNGASYAKETLQEYKAYGADLAAVANTAEYESIAVDQSWDVVTASNTSERMIRDDLAALTAENADALLARATALVNGGEFSWETEVESQDKAMRLYSRHHANALLKRQTSIDEGTTSFDVTVSVFSLGPVAVANAPYEMFQLNGQTIKGITMNSDGTYTKLEQDHGFEMVIVASKCNGSEGYIPTADGYANGGYSTDVSWFTSGTGEELANTYLDLLAGLKPKS